MNKNIILELFDKLIWLDNSIYSMHKLLDNKKIILYGAGIGYTTLSTFFIQKYHLNVHAIIDIKFKHKNTYFGIPAFSPNNYIPTNKEKESSVVIITVGKKEYHKEIFQYLNNLGFKNIILANNIYEYHLYCTSIDVEKRGFNYYLDNKKQIIKCLELFTDDLSCEIFRCVLQTHIQKIVINIPNNKLEEQYFPKDIKLNKGYSNFINCGAYNGDTIKQLNNLFGKIDSLICFEPDIHNFNLLTQYIQCNYNEISNNIILFPCGVFNCETLLKFYGNNGVNSMLSNNGNFIVQCVALDHVIPEFKPTFIQMDIEGAELEALKGAETLIKKNKPDLAICVYHKTSDIWEIPLYLESLNLGYKFYLRNYTSFISETVLYATT